MNVSRDKIQEGLDVIEADHPLKLLDKLRAIDGVRVLSVYGLGVKHYAWVQKPKLKKGKEAESQDEAGAEK